MSSAANVAAQVTGALQGVVTGGTGTAAALGSRPVAGKTGTAENFQDAWFCGYVPQLATCVWVGYPKGEIPLLNVEGVGEVFGGTLPAEIWHNYMAGAVGNLPVKQLPDAGLQRRHVHHRHRHLQLRLLLADRVTFLPRRGMRARWLRIPSTASTISSVRRSSGSSAPTTPGGCGGVAARRRSIRRPTAAGPAPPRSRRAPAAA